MNKLDRFMQLFSYLTFVLAFVLMAVYITLLHWNYESVQVLPIPDAEYKLIPSDTDSNPLVEIVKKNYYPGDDIDYKVRYCINTDKSVRMGVQLVDGINREIGHSDRVFKRGCEEKIVNYFSIPSNTHPGWHKLLFTVIVKPNSIGTFELKYESDYFYINDEI